MPPFIHRVRRPDEAAIEGAPSTVQAKEKTQHRRGASAGRVREAVASVKRSGSLDQSSRVAPSTEPGKEVPQRRRGAARAKRRRHTVTMQCRGECTAEVLGTVRETELQHRRRHQNFSGACPRCLWSSVQKNGQQLVALLISNLLRLLGARVGL